MKPSLKAVNRRALPSSELYSSSTAGVHKYWRSVHVHVLNVVAIQTCETKSFFEFKDNGNDGK